MVLVMINLPWILKSLSDAKYADVRHIKQHEVEIALRHESSDAFEHFSERVACRAVSEGYGIASTDKLDKGAMKKISKLALRKAKSVKRKVKLKPVKVEEGRVEHEVKNQFDHFRALELMEDLRDRLLLALGKVYSRFELVTSYCHTDSILITSEGTNVSERTPKIDITLYLIAKRIQQGFASKILGGRGGFEIVEGQDWDQISEKLAARARDSMMAKSLSSNLKGRRCKVLLDNEGAGAIAHEIAHMLEADVHQKSFFQSLKVYGELEIVDNPSISQGYGSFTWDDEGVKAHEKVLLKDGVINLLHSRITAAGDGEPGNAHGVIHMPRPMVSNVYIKPSDWKNDEIIADTQKGVYANGVVRAECDISDGNFELIPEISYLIRHGRIGNPIKHLKIMGNILDLIQRIDAAGSDVWLRPNMEKGFCISEGGPHIRIDGAPCL